MSSSSASSSSRSLSLTSAHATGATAAAAVTGSAASASGSSASGKDAIELKSLEDVGDGGGGVQRPLADGGDADEDGLGDDVVQVDNVHKTYLLGVEGVPALRGVSLSIRRGEFVVILGKSGGGKTSMLNIIGTIDKPTKGQLTICGQRITSKTTDAQFAVLRLRKLGFVFQTFNLISSMTALENVELPLILDGRMSREKRRRRCADLLTRVGMGARMDHLPSQLSGGEQQRVTIARAVANFPDVLLLDEPTGDLDTMNSNIVLKMLVDLNRKQKITCVMVTHDRALKVYAHRVVHMVDGKIHRIEHVPAHIRKEADQQLAQTNIDDRRGAGDRRAAALAAQQKNLKEEDVTEYRVPHKFYPYLDETSASAVLATGQHAAAATHAQHQHQQKK